ncbi:hypothetical protein BN946_scf185013.g86 [Trametes cinnabarina]|uniref:H/ACA ribonucleoprotein complex non-core subunit NAF1 n=1 Tax=Pycnoporus cinnabarinus TaxID=5643 RepID=A0A060SGY8_PYCCI|nr:hypothetical protein BN946_scf185013.g86 [Trametes cinnabarina]
MAAPLSFTVPSAIPQDLQLIQEIIGDIPIPSSSTEKVDEAYSDHDHGTDSGTDSEKEVEADILGGLDDDDTEMSSERNAPPSESTSDSDSSDSDSESEEGEQHRSVKLPPKVADAEVEDDEDGDVGGPSGVQVRTKNEVVEVDITIPEISEVGPHDTLEKVGEVMSIVDKVVIVKGVPSEIANRGSEKALDSDTLLVFEDRKVLGYIFETFGPTSEPLYQVRFNQRYPLDTEKVKIGRTVYHVPERSNYVFVRQLRQYKGSDASNVHDEEPAEDELEFSDDEQEAAHKRALAQRREQSRARSVSSSRHSTPLPSRMRDQDMVDDPYGGSSYEQSLSYNDMDFGAGPSRPAPIPYDDPYSDSYGHQVGTGEVLSGVKTRAEDEDEFVDRTTVAGVGVVVMTVAGITEPMAGRAGRMQHAGGAGSWGYPEAPMQSYDFSFGFQYPQYSPVQPHINPRFASNFGMAGMGMGYTYGGQPAPYGSEATGYREHTASGGVWNGQWDLASQPRPEDGRGDSSKRPSSSPQASSSKEGMKTRQKRVMPARSRRGGPGVGGCETDIMILETMKRKAESEPLIPATTRFLLTTKSALLPPSSESFEAQLNTHAYGRYFDRPEVQQAYRAQQLIQTPEFTELPQDANETVDTSDAAYEKRHRKYETFEKRQRLREKEKLKHEHYKLKERIDQLRAMDSSAFLALPYSDFALPSAPLSHVGSAGHTSTDEPTDSSNLHGAAAYHEGERRRKLMLETALQLEQRYRTLLPPDRRWMEKKLSGKPSSQIASIGVADEDMGEEVLEDGGEDEAVEEDVEELVEDDGESEVDPEELERERSKKLKLRIKFPSRMLSDQQPSAAAVEKKPPPSRGGGKQITLSPFFKPHVSGGKGSAGSPLRSASYTASETASKRARYSADTADTLHQAPSAKKPRVGLSASTKSKASKASNGVHKAESVSSAGAKKEQTVCVLVTAAIRQSSAPTARKTQRHVTAFGARVPQEIEEVRDFEIPQWVLEPPSVSDDGDRQGSYEHSYSYAGRSDRGYSASIAETAD